MLKHIWKNPRIIILIVAVLLSLWFIAPQPFAEGAAIRSVERDSAASLAGIVAPGPNVKPTAREVILAVNNRPITSAADYLAETASLEPNRSISIKTNLRTYRVVTQPEMETRTLNGTMTLTETVNRTINGTTTLVNETRTVPRTEDVIVGTKDLGITAYDAPTSNIRTGLDLQGGTRVLLQPEKKLAQEDLESLISTMTQRLNVYGLSDLTVRDASDLSGNQFIIVEIAGASQGDVQNLLAQQGKFEARINNETVFIGGRDITFVCRSADCSGIDPQFGCGPSAEGYACRFRFSIAVTQEAAQRQADLTSKLDIIPGGPGQSSYLSAPLDLYLDDEIVDSLSIGAELRGSPATSISISGGGAGPNQRAAADDALAQMHRLQTVLITGSLPVKLDIIKTDAISSSLGNQFAGNALLIGVLSIAAVMAILMIAYRRIALAIPIFFAMIFEVVIIGGVASFIGWNIDLAAVAGIIAAVGTGIDDQIVITDEALRGAGKHGRAWKDRLKSAFFIIFGAYLTVVVAMAPLIFAGAGLLKGFAITTILGVTIGVFITRPAFAVVIEKIIEK